MPSDVSMSEAHSTTIHLSYGRTVGNMWRCSASWIPVIQNTIGRLNYMWANTKDAYETAAQIGSLSDALDQSLMRCDLVKRCREATRHVLLAQMPAPIDNQFPATYKAIDFD